MTFLDVCYEVQTNRLFMALFQSALVRFPRAHVNCFAEWSRFSIRLHLLTALLVSLSCVSHSCFPLTPCAFLLQFAYHLPPFPVQHVCRAASHANLQCSFGDRARSRFHDSSHLIFSRWCQLYHEYRLNYFPASFNRLGNISWWLHFASFQNVFRGKI